MREPGPFARCREGMLRLWGTLSGGRDDRDVARELAHHVELAEEELLRRGHSPGEARRLARVQAGNCTQVLENMRDQRGIPALSTYWLDIKLGLRMLRKNWGLTLLGGLTMVAAMTIGASIFNLVNAILGTSLPLEEGDRIVVIQPFDPATRQPRDSSREDFGRWRTSLRSLENIGAFQTVQRNVIFAGGPPIPVQVGEISASGFQVPRISPHLGRSLLAEDQLPAAPPVLVIGYEVWQAKFAGRADVVGQQVRVDGVSHTIVGVMPRGFAFPVNHQYWTSLKGDTAARVVVFARLAAGASLESAQAEAGAMGLIEPKAATGTPRQLQPRVVPYVTGIGFASAPGVMMILLPLVLPLLLVPPCVNIGILVYARTVAREGEFAARAALGAGRARIVGQILIEVLLLAAGAACVALVLASKLTVLLRYLFAIGDQPFWMDFTLSYKTIVFAAGLAVIAAAISGGVPAFRATGRWNIAALHAIRGGSNPRLGKVWTFVVVAQVALAVAVVPTVAQIAWSTMRPSIFGPGFAAGEFLTARLAMDRHASSNIARFSAARAEMVRQLRAEPGVTAVTMSEVAPFEEPDVLVEVDAGAGENTRRERKSVMLNHVDEAFFHTFHISLLTGRWLEAADGNPARGGILVNRSFARRILGDRNPLGRRLRVIAPDAVPASAPPPEYEIVGVVGDLFVESHMPTMYRPLTQSAATETANGEKAGIHQVRLALHTGRTSPPNLATRLREIAAKLDPALRVDDVQNMDEIYRLLSMGEYGGGIALAALTLCGTLFSVAGIYTSMAFTVVQRRREIGIRSALGAPPFRLIAGVFRKVLLPVCIGMPLGGLAAVLLNCYLAPLLLEGEQPSPWILPATEMLIVLVAALALAGPARRALRIDSVEALRDG